MTLALSIDIRGAFSGVHPLILHRILVGKGIHPNIINFITHITTKRMISFHSSGENKRTCAMGVPQGGVLCPLLFNLYLSGIASIIPHHMKYTMYADDLIYTRFKDPNNLMEKTYEFLQTLSAWLGKLHARVGMEIAPKKTSGCVCSRSTTGFDDIDIRLNGESIKLEPALKHM